MNHPMITKETLEEFGITLEDQEEASLLEHLNTTLEERVGAEITEALDDEQLATMLDMQEKDDKQAMGAWLTENVPELNEIVQDEIDILLGEVAENRKQL